MTWPSPVCRLHRTQEAEGKSHAAVSLRDNRRAGWILTALLTLLSLVMALSKVVLDAAGLSAGQLAAGAEPEVVSFWAMLQITPLEAVLENWWPTIPALGLLWRWRAWQVLGATLAYWLLCSAIEAVLVGIRDPISAGEYLALVSGVPLLMLGLLCLAPTTRAIAPWLLPLFLLLLAGSLAGEDLLGVLNERTPGLLEPAYSTIGGVGVVIAFYALLPWLLAWWPIRLLGRALARAMRSSGCRKRSSSLAPSGVLDCCFPPLASTLGAGSWRIFCRWRGSRR